MNYNIVPIAEGDDEFIEDKLVEYNLSMVPAMQNKLYEKNGYSVFGTLEDCPKGHIRYYLKKSLLF